MNEANERNGFFALTAVLALSVCLPLPGADSRIAHIPPICPFYNLTGLPCPGCGLTRAFVCLGHGRFAESLHWHPAGWLLFGICLTLWGRSGLRWALKRPVATVPPRFSRAFTILALGTLITVGVARMAWAWHGHQSNAQATSWPLQSRRITSQ